MSSMSPTPERAAARPATRTAPVLAYLALAVSAAIWASNAIVGRTVREALSPATVGFWQWSIGVLVLLPFVWNEIVLKRAVIRRSWRKLMVLGVIGTATYATFTMWSLRYTSATNYSLFNSTIPMWVMLLMWLRQGTRPSGLQFAGFFVSLAGVTVIIAHGDIHELLALRLNPGDLLALAAMMVWSLYTVLLAERPPELSALAYVVVSGFFGLVVVAPMYAVDVAREMAHLRIDAVIVGAVLFLALFRTIGATITYNFGIDGVGPARAAPFIHLVPVFGAAMAYLILGERVGLYHLVGFALVLAGIYIATVKRR